MHQPGRQRRKRIVFLIHSLFGLKLSLFLLFVCVTGTIAVVSDEIEWLASPVFRASVTDRWVSWETQYAAAKAAFPTYHISFIEAGEEPYLATRISATGPDGAWRVIYVDPANGEVTGETGFVTVRSFMRALHYLLFTPGDWGFFPVTSLGFVLLVSLVTGLLTYKKFWRGFIKRPRTNRGVRVLWGDLHRLAALWSLWFVLLMALTSIWYFAERILYRAAVPTETAGAVVSAEALARLGPVPPVPLPLDRLVDIARVALPGLDVRLIVLSSRPEQPLSVAGQADAWLVRDRTNRVELNPYTGDVLAVRRAEEMGLLERWVHTADPLHFGDFGGIWSKLVWVVFGILLCLIEVSGAIVYAKRTARATEELSRGLAGYGRQPAAGR